MSKRALVICYYFPPLGLGGVGRPLNLYKYLPNHDYACDILTVKPVAYRAYEPELLHELNTTNIYRSGSYDPQRMLYLMGVRTMKHSTIKKGRTVSDKFFPDSKVGWVRPAVRLGKRLLRKNDYTAIISTSPPISSHLVAMDLARHAGLPWIADFRDFWTMYKIEESYTKPDNIRKGNELLDRIRAAATRLTAVNPAIIDYLGTGDVITNGFDIDRAKLWKLPTDTTSCVIGIPGNFNEERVVEPLLAVVDRLKRSHADLWERLRFVQVGQVDVEWLSELFEKHGLSERFAIHGLQKRERTIELFSACHLFYLGLTADREQGILPQRMFDLAASGRKVLASAAPDSEVCRFIRETGAGFCFSEPDTTAAVEFLAAQAQSTLDGKLNINPLPDYAAPYSSVAMAKKFAELMDRL
ncbi:hypothetical protein KQH82_03380 [bacterium]|nr:hypothetical protein [bacterium]